MQGGSKISRALWGALILVITVCLSIPGPTPARAGGSGDNNLTIGAWTLGVIGTSAILYGLWENSPSRQGKERLIPGEFYVGGYLGASLAPSQNLNFSDGVTVNNGVTLTNQGAVTAQNNKFAPAVVGGLKFGYFCHRYPNFGLEIETNYNRSPVRQQTLSLSRPVQGSTFGRFDHDNWVNWTMALHFVGRYGFLRDSEVPFGRLQPYVGIGPGLVVMYDEVDSAKNFAIDVMAGVRYMMLKNVSAFVEYKFSQQFNAEMEAHSFVAPDNSVVRGTATLDYTSHKVVVGVAYHF